MLDQAVPGVQHCHDQDLHLKAGGQLWDVPPAPRVEQGLRPMDVYMNQGWMNGMPQGAAPRPPMGAPCMGAMENIRHCFMGEQPNQWYYPQAQVVGAPAGQDQRAQGGFAFPGGNTGPMGEYGWPGGPPLKDRGKDVRGEEGHSTAAQAVEEKDEPQEEETRPGKDHRLEKRRKTEERDADRAHDKRERRRDRRRRGETGGSRSPHREKESTTRRSESEKSPGPSAAESQESGRVTKGPIAPLPECMKAPGGPPPQKPSMPTPKEERKSTHR